jgi:hypothetical protein
MHRVQSAIQCIIMSTLTILTLTSYFTKLPLAFLFIYKLTKLSKFNNMQFMSLNMMYDFIQVIYSTRKHYTKVEYFPRHILFIYCSTRN